MSVRIIVASKKEVVQEKSEVKGSYLNGKKHSLWSYWDQNGSKLRENIYLNDFIHGLAIDYYSNGRKHTMVNYENGIQNCIYEEWNEHDYLTVEGFYKNGKKHGHWVYRNPGKIFTTGECFDNCTKVSCSQLTR